MYFTLQVRELSQDSNLTSSLKVTKLYTKFADGTACDSVSMQTQKRLNPFYLFFLHSRIYNMPVEVNDIYINLLTNASNHMSRFLSALTEELYNVLFHFLNNFTEYTGDWVLL